MQIPYRKYYVFWEFVSVESQKPTNKYMIAFYVFTKIFEIIALIKKNKWIKFNEKYNSFNLVPIITINSVFE